MCCAALLHTVFPSSTQHPLGVEHASNRGGACTAPQSTEANELGNPWEWCPSSIVMAQAWNHKQDRDRCTQWVHRTDATGWRCSNELVL